MTETTPNQRQPSQKLLFILFGMAVVLTAMLVVLVSLFLRSRQNRTDIAAAPADSNVAQDVSQPEDYALSNSVSITLGGDEQGHGLTHVASEKDGLTVIEVLDGVSSRALRLGPHNATTLNFYFQIDPAFKQHDLSTVRFDVEYLDPHPGTLGIHYDARDADRVSNSKYRDAKGTVQLSGSRVWRKATFRTQGDAIFNNRQNGWSDFRIWATTPLLYVRRVTVTQQPVIKDSWPVDFSTSNQVSITLGDEKSEDGLRHIADERDGLTTIVNLDGVTCRQLNLAAEGKFFGSFYFTIAPSFKSNALTNALVEVEYLAKRSNTFRVQFDGIEGGMNRSYVTVVPIGAQLVRRYGEFSHALTPTLDTWSVATFHITNATFRNSQNGGADFRFEVIPPDMYVRRVIVRREKP